MSAMASQTTGVAIVCSTLGSGPYQIKHQSSASLAFVRGIHRDPWIPRTKDQLHGKCFHLMTSSWMWRINQTLVIYWIWHSYLNFISAAVTHAKCECDSWLPLLTVIPAWMSNYIHYKMCYETTYPFPNSNDATDEDWKWISNFITHFPGHMITYQCWD